MRVFIVEDKRYPDEHPTKRVLGIFSNREEAEDFVKQKRKGVVINE